MTLLELNDALLIAHEKAAIDIEQVSLLVDLYHQAYTLTLDDNPTAAYFYLTNAYVYALDADHWQADDLEKILIDAGRL